MKELTFLELKKTARKESESKTVAIPSRLLNYIKAKLKIDPTILGIKVGSKVLRVAANELPLVGSITKKVIKIISDKLQPKTEGSELESLLSDLLKASVSLDTLKQLANPGPNEHPRISDYQEDLIVTFTLYTRYMDRAHYKMIKFEGTLNLIRTMAHTYKEANNYAYTCLEHIKRHNIKREKHNKELHEQNQENQKLQPSYNLYRVHK